jgi:type II secretory pathway pseudopilin PulG
MQLRKQPRRVGADRERGYVLLAILFALTLMIIGLTAAAPAIATSIKRDREIELQHRGNQYARAIQLYFRKFGRYPSSLEQLENTNNLRFLRKRYADPITGKDEWKIIRFGQAHPKARPAYLAGATPAGSINGATPAAGLGGSAAGRAAAAGAASGGGFQLNFGGAGAGSGAAGATSSASSPGGQAPGASTGSGISGAANASDISKPLTGSLGGSLPIVGVASTSDKESLKEMDGKSKYSEWEFTYDPTIDTTRGNVGVPQQQSANPGSTSKKP